MFIAVVTIFAICWLPYHMFYVYSYHQPQISSKSFVPHMFLGFYWLAMANSMVNPIIYYWMNKRFRHYFQKVMCFCCFQLWHNSNMSQFDNTYLQPNSYSVERKSKSCKTFNTSIQNHSYYIKYKYGGIFISIIVISCFRYSCILHPSYISFTVLMMHLDTQTRHILNKINDNDKFIPKALL